jgi:tRNA nucleotidyltransferase (CCA-adding enzyme)
MNSRRNYFEHYEHPADIGIRGIGESKQEAFRQAAMAVTAAIVELDTVQPAEQVDIKLEIEDNELALVDWLNAVIYEMSVRGMLFSDFEVSINGNKLTAKAFGEKIDSHRHKPSAEVKAATYSDLKVEQNKQGEWIAQCIIDV